MRTTRTPGRPLSLGGAVLAVALAAGCSQAGPAVSLAPTTGPAPATTTGTAEPTQAATATLGPLSGVPVTAAVAKRPAVAVALPVTGAVGLDKADLVYQEYETPTRLRAVALFQSRDAAELGPVGQIRPVDPQLLPILRPLYANTGGSTGTTSLLAEAKVADLSSAAQPAAYASGTAGVTTSTARVLAAAPAGALPPPAVLGYAGAGEKFATASLRPATTLTITVPGGTAETWTWSASAKRWNRAGSTGVAVANLVVQTVEYKAITLKDPVRSAQSARVFGRGAGYALSGGQYTPIGWYKPGPVLQTNYTDRAGVPLRFAPGPTWIVLTPPGAQVVAR